MLLPGSAAVGSRSLPDTAAVQPLRGVGCVCQGCCLYVWCRCDMGGQGGRGVNVLFAILRCVQDLILQAEGHSKLVAWWEAAVWTARHDQTLQVRIRCSAERVLCLSVIVSCHVCCNGPCAAVRTCLCICHR